MCKIPLCRCLSRLLAMPLAAWVVLLAGAAALGTALIAQYFFDVEPCDLCIWQRCPYVGAVILGLAALLWKPYDARSRALLGVAAVVFFLGFGLAIYQTGVEQGWWESTCAIKPLGSKNIADVSLNDVRNQLLATVNGASCDEITWSFLGVSMSIWNIFAFLVLALFAGMAAMGCGEVEGEPCRFCCLEKKDGKK